MLQRLANAIGGLILFGAILAALWLLFERVAQNVVRTGL